MLKVIDDEPISPQENLSAGHPIEIVKTIFPERDCGPAYRWDKRFSIMEIESVHSEISDKSDI
ncbi:hypothetical protein [Methylovirgula sp. HY1]|uniref:hypothetical protein n=1 Tax=Methylovirgula sp. HY1 TaxID=2822761 RepID=UPI001C5A7220|nr:hypothetical protein [Methylovirgula sp. HY1]